MPDTLIVNRRFCGPPNSGNGGYVCGLLAERFGQPLEVMLRQPPPLDRALTLAAGDPARLLDGDTVIAEARHATLDLDVPHPPSLAQAQLWSQHYAGFESHAFPGCFTCGPARAAGDGLRIFPGRAPDGVLVAASFVPDASLAGVDGTIPLAVAWAALDCSGYFAAAHPTQALLGKMCAQLSLPLMAATSYVVIGWSLGREGRKVHAGTAVFDGHGLLHGSAKQTWITIS